MECLCESQAPIRTHKMSITFWAIVGVFGVDVEYCIADWYIIPSIMCNSPTPEAAQQPHTIIFPPEPFTVGIICLLS